MYILSGHRIYLSHCYSIAWDRLWNHFCYTFCHTVRLHCLFVCKHSYGRNFD